MNISVFLLIFFYMIPIAFIQSVVNVNELSARVPALEYATRHFVSQISQCCADRSSTRALSSLYGCVRHNDCVSRPMQAFISGFLPTLIVIIFFALLPLILSSMAVCEL